MDHEPIEVFILVEACHNSVSLSLSPQQDHPSIQRKSFEVSKTENLIPMLMYHQQTAHGRPWKRQFAIVMVQ
jgi:hypothetical protein